MNKHMAFLLAFTAGSAVGLTSGILIFQSDYPPNGLIVVFVSLAAVLIGVALHQDWEVRGSKRAERN